MYQLKNFQKIIGRILATILVAILLLITPARITPALTGTAQADAQNLVVIAKDFLKIIDNDRAGFEGFSRDSQVFLKDFVKLNY